MHADGRFCPGISRFCRETNSSIRGQLMADRAFLNLPFFDDSHRKLSSDLEAWCDGERDLFSHAHGKDTNLDTTCREMVKKLGDTGWLRYAVPKAYGGAIENLDVRSLCIIRET